MKADQTSENKSTDKKDMFYCCHNVYLAVLFETISSIVLHHFSYKPHMLAQKVELYYSILLNSSSIGGR